MAADPPPGPPAWLAQLLTGINAQHNTDMQALIAAQSTETDRLIAAIPALVPAPPPAQAPDPALATAITDMATSAGRLATASLRDRDPKSLSFLKRDHLPDTVKFDHTLPTAEATRANAYRLVRTTLSEHVRTWAINQSREVESYILDLPLDGRYQYFANHYDTINLRLIPARDVRIEYARAASQMTRDIPVQLFTASLADKDYTPAIYTDYPAPFTTPALIQSMRFLAPSWI